MKQWFPALVGTPQNNLFALNAFDGVINYGSELVYIVWFSSYQGNSNKLSERYKELGVGASVDLSYADNLKETWTGKRFHSVFDNYFTTIHLLNDLKIKGIFGTGRIRESNSKGPAT